MPGGTIQITVSDQFSIVMTGPVLKIADGTIAAESFRQRV